MPALTVTTTCQRDARACHLLPILIIAVCLGCGGGPELGEVTGRVTLDGQPVPGATVTFQPTDGRQPSTGETNENGEYTLVFTEKQAGALVGEHTVAIETFQLGTDAAGEVDDVPERIPARYNISTELQETVNAGLQEINFELTSR